MALSPTRRKAAEEDDRWMGAKQSIDPTAWTSLLDAGLASSFLKLPYVAPEESALREHRVGAAIYGVPFDVTSVSRTGANCGPRGIREASCRFIAYNAALDFDLLDVLNPVDAGDCDIALGDAERTFARAQADIGEILAAGALALTLGGDHSITIPAVRAVRAHVEDPGLILMDTHLGTAMDVNGEQLDHACPVARAVDAGFDPRKIALVGVSGWLNPRLEIEFCREHGITVIWLEEIWEKGTKWALKRAREVSRAAADGVYISVDLSSLDAAPSVGTWAPTPGALTSREAIELVRGLSRGGLLGIDVVEATSSRHSSTATSLVGARIALEAMALHAGAGG